ncbi:MAG: helix-turn-helix transcriptional regulator [Planctomycetota bacterium]
MDLEAQLRSAIQASGWSIKRLADTAGTSYGLTHRFCTGGGGITLRTAAKLAAVLGLELRKARKPGTKGR